VTGRIRAARSATLNFDFAAAVGMFASAITAAPSLDRDVLVS